MNECRIREDIGKDEPPKVEKSKSSPLLDSLHAIENCSLEQVIALNKLRS